MMRNQLISALLLWLLCGAGAMAADVLQNEFVRATFDDRGLKSIADVPGSLVFDVGHDGFSLTVDGQAISSDGPPPRPEKSDGHMRVYVFGSGEQTIRVIYELQPGWHFLSKQLILPAPTRPVRINRVEMLAGAIGDFPQTQVRSGVFLRIQPGAGVFLALQNPFLKWSVADHRATAAYEPEMYWKPEYGPFESDRLCMGFYHSTGIRYPLQMEPEWTFGANREPSPERSLDWGQIQAMTDCERAFLLDRRDHSVRVHVGWCENDYQIDAATAAGREEYKRIINRAADLGCNDVLYAPNNSLLASLKENTDAWGWEEVLWFGLGQKIRKSQWDVHKDAIPASIAEMLDYAKSKNVRLLAYVYPSLPFKQDPAWTAWANGHTGGYHGADTGLRSFQDWLLDQLQTFHSRTGIGGFSFDHWFINYDHATSRYAQWYGCRRVLQELRKRIPDVVIDGRQQYQYYGPWTWLAGSYPHPTSTDEQPQSFRAFPDLHLDRVSADRQRFAAWWYRVENFCPPEILPGFITHQTPRDDAKGVMRRDRFRARDWDYLGWKYSLISSIATAPMNQVINMIPARDVEEYDAFSAEDQKWLKSWLDWTDHNRDILLNLRPILNQPMIGHVDGTAAIKGDHGFIFLFNPNYRAMEARFSLDASIGLTSGERFALRQLYPDAQKGRVMAVGRRGDLLSIPLHGTDALVLEVSPLPAEIHDPLLVGSAGTANLHDSQLDLTDISGEPGTTLPLQVLVPNPASVRKVKLNGLNVAFSRTNNSIQVTVRFEGKPFSQAQQIGTYDPTFAGGHFHGRISIPKRIFQQLRDRTRRWPINYSEDDLKATWLGPSRLLLFVNVADPTDKMHAQLRIDGQPVPLTKAYSSIYASAVERTFVGWYADVSSLAPGQDHDFELTLPEMKKGRFQGLFFDNVEPEYASTVGRAMAQ